MKPVNDRIIDGVEQMFLPQGASFDEERRNFIKRLSSCDLLAVTYPKKT